MDHILYLDHFTPKAQKTRNTYCRTRSLSNATFSFLIMWRSSSTKSAAVYKISWKADDFSLIYGDISIFKMAAIRHLGNVLPIDNRIYNFQWWHYLSKVRGLWFYHHTRPPPSLCCWPQLPVKFHVNLIQRSEDIAIEFFRIFGLKCLFRPPKWGFWGTLDP